MTINCNSRLIDLNLPKVMGILNVTPNSFYDGGKHNEINSIMHQVDKMLSEGADFIDIGAYSSKPSAEFVSDEEEIKRLIQDSVVKVEEGAKLADQSGKTLTEITGA